MTLLCIDDDPEDIELFQDAVRVIDESYICIVAKNGRDGLSKLKTLKPDYIFLDINMPIMDGKETLMSIRQDHRLNATPVCILSTAATRRDIALYRALGADKCLVKPSSFQELIRSLRGVFEETKA